MTSARFAALIGAFGASPARWPAAERGEAVKASGANADAIRAQAALDRALDLPAPEFDLDQFAARALATAPSPSPKLAAQRAPPAAGWALAACALFGVLLGLGVGAVAPTDSADRSVAAAFGAAPDTATEESDG